MRITRRAFSAAALSVLAAPTLATQTWRPTRPVRLIVAYAPGGSADVLARLLAPKLGDELGGSVVVENRPGGAGNVGTAAFARAPADGYTIGIGSVSSHAINPALFGDKLPFKVPSDFTPISQVISQPNALIVHSDVPAQNMQEFIQWAKQRPGVGFGTAGAGSSSHLIGELLNMTADVRLTHIPYKSGGLSLQDLLGGHLSVLIDNVTTAASVVPTGKGRALAVSGARRSSRLPDVPTFAEQGLRGLELTSWQGIFGPAGLAPEIRDTIHAATAKVLADADIQRRLKELGSEPVGSSPAEFSGFISAEMPRWAMLVKRAGLKAE
jgi:tripartite-type tricarboxylate transporter receptor subunit TctC